MPSQADLCYFIDCNHPGVVYVGTQEDMRAFDDEGAQTERVDLAFLRDHDEWQLRRLHGDVIPEFTYDDMVDAYSECIQLLDRAERLAMIVPEFDDSLDKFEQLRQRLYTSWQSRDGAERQADPTWTKSTRVRHKK